MTPAPSPPGDQPSADRPATHAGLTARYLVAVGQEVAATGLTPAGLARAAAQVLPVDGAGLSTLWSALRLPLGASSDACYRAEELQTSLGDGPCLAAAEAQTAVLLDHDDLEDRWPLYTAELTGKTPFRAVAAVPLRTHGRGVFAALDLYTTQPRLSTRLDPREVEAVATTVAGLLTTCVAELDDLDSPADGPEWYRAAAGRRHNVWVAVGMVMSTRAGRSRDALSLLRAHAYSQGAGLDDLADDVVNRRLAVEDLTD